ncbi:MAG TPA: lysophospholipase [Candidatus Bipolaricaulis sp.]|nr:lysophospholipase [Candidatus Bipolaricaulis sp.]HRS13405.1 lysophospholipase [Candidatus Bipolaricaulis sp.]HRU22165.1 lysophospholipase [Candidatus Bipolaricaulis sp.]
METPTEIPRSLRTADGLSLFVRVWPGEGKGSLGIIHGYGEHSGRYDGFARWLNARGWSVAACDLRGHGNSPGRRGHIRRFADYLHDATALHGFLQGRAGGRPVFLLGHSLGGLIAIRYLQGGAEGLGGLILSAPFLKAELPIPTWKVALSRVLSRGWPSFSSPSGLGGALVSRDPEIVAEYGRDPLMHRKATARWLTETLTAQEDAFAWAPELSIPLLLLHGDADPIASVSATRRFFAAAGSHDKTLNVYGGFLHEVLNEIGKERVWEDIASWLDERSRTEGEIRTKEVMC